MIISIKCYKGLFLLLNRSYQPIQINICLEG